MKSGNNFSIKRLIAICSLLFAICGNAFAASNIPSGDVGDFGAWATPHNHELFKSNLTDDISEFQNNFQKKVSAPDYVPVEAKVGRAFIGAMSMIGEVLERSLVRFVSIFLVIMFAFWIAFESYEMARSGKGETRKLIESIIKKGLLITIWIAVIEQGPAQLFMWVMAPIISIGTYLSDLILNSVAAASNASLPDTCAAIHKYVGAHNTGREIIDSVQTAQLLCVPTRLSGFFYTAVAVGWKWMAAGIGTSVFTFTAGLVFIVIFIYNIWRFAFIALGVIADLFLGLLMLPFTAIAMTFGPSEDKTYFGEKGATSYAGIAGQIFNKFLELFTTQNMSTQVDRFINAIIYFVSLSVIVALCAAILSGVVGMDFATMTPVANSDDFMTILIVGCLVAYLAAKASDFAKKLGGSINNGLPEIENDVKKVWGNTVKTVQSWRKAAKK